MTRVPAEAVKNTKSAAEEMFKNSRMIMIYKEYNTEKRA